MRRILIVAVSIPVLFALAFVIWLNSTPGHYYVDPCGCYMRYGTPEISDGQKIKICTPGCVPLSSFGIQMTEFLAQIDFYK